MDPLTILIWMVIVIVAMYILVHLVIFGGIALAFIIGLISTIFSGRKAKKARKARMAPRRGARSGF